MASDKLFTTFLPADIVGGVRRPQTPTAVVVDRFGNAFVADFSHHAIRKISPQGKISTLAGNPLIAGPNGLPEGGYADGTGKNARFNTAASGGEGGDFRVTGSQKC